MTLRDAPADTGAVPSRSPALRRLVLWIGARCLRWSYREQRLLHADRIPAAGPVLLIGNHPNDLPDVLLGYFTTERPVRYLATVSAATSWLARTTYAALGVIPVARVRDARKMQAAGMDVVGVNRAATDSVAAAFAAGEVVGAFPEGGVRDVPTLAEFRTGVASMVLKYVESGATNDVEIVPFGIQYEAGRRAGSDVITVVGAPLSVRGWLAQQPEQARGAAALTRRMHAMVMDCTRNSPDWDTADRRDSLIAALAAQASPRDPLTAAAALAPFGACLAMSATPTDVAVHAAAAALADAVERAGGIGTSAVDHARLLVALDVQETPTPLPTMVLWMGAPAGAIGWVTHGPVFAAVDRLARRLAKARADVVALRFVPGLHLVVLWYVLVAAGLVAGCTAMGISAAWAVPVILLLPRFGDLALGWSSWYRAWRLVRDVHRWSTPERMALRDAAAVVRGALERQRQAGSPTSPGPDGSD